MTNIQPYNLPEAELMSAAPQTAGTIALQSLEQQAQAMSNAMSIATAMCETQMVPKAYFKKPEEGAAAILYGAELGLSATQSLQQIMVINGKPGIETRTAVALLKRHNYEIRTVETSDTSVTVEGIGPRGEHETSTWTWDRANTAGYTSNKLYKTIPQQMLYAKAAMEVARKIAPHVLSGIAYSTEELQLEPVKATAKRMDQPRERGADAVRAALAAKQEPIPAEPEKDWVAEVQAVTTGAGLNEVMNEASNHLTGEPWDQLCNLANTKLAEIEKEEQ